ncbi:sigma-70 family RNA polymerase sigma factor [Gemmata sp. G18]|uniref:Sigma-70 family RNA polymerase sigma factor n=1 Tax=Gemmata palustris TaxID=2822762 RepID=A0ABS5BXW9_9BACT|nr:sigma-70 family RNA polymerase sigma factor [Gemmata palustris]MBP3958508.1 sigma-70 family RNA polymerase sigma factor [Gemmata palustris]
MSGTGINNYLRAVGIDPAATGPSDAELVARFSAAQDEAAFELLVWRHAPLLQRVCRSVLRDQHAAEDATQATFLALARKAGTFTGRGTVVGWLYRVARRVSVRLAKQRARYPAASAELDRVPAPDGPGAPADTGPLCEEIDRLPERYRVPVLLCFFEGLTHTEAARRTGLPVGTIAGRLSRAKVLLARRLSRRGGALVAVALPVVSGTFVGSTARAAALFATGHPIAPLVSGSVLSLARGATQPMISSFKLTAAVAVVCTVSAGVWAFNAPAPVPNEDTPPAAALTAPNGDAPPVAALTAVDPPAPKSDARIAGAVQRAKSANTLKQILIAIHNYADAYGAVPQDIVDKNGKPLLSWRVAILPFVEHERLYKEFKLDEPWDSATNKKLLAQMPNLFRVTDQAKGETKTYYRVFSGPGAAFETGQKLTFAGITDGLSNTIGVVEAGPPSEWTKPGDIAYDPKKPFPKLEGPFKNVVMAGMMDGSIVPFKPDLDRAEFRKFVERADGQVVNIDDAKADVTALTKEDLNALDKVLKEDAELSTRFAKLLAERTKLLEQLAKKPAPELDLEKFSDEQTALRAHIVRLEEQIEMLKKALEKK